MENSHVLPIQELLFLLYRQRQPWSLNLASGVRPGDAPLGSRIPDRLPGSAASMARPRDCSAGTGIGTRSRAPAGPSPRFPAGPTPLDFCIAPPRPAEAPPHPRPQREATPPKAGSKDHSLADESPDTVGPVPTGRLLQAEMPQTWTLQDSIPAKVPLPAHSSQSDPRVNLFPNLLHAQ